MTRRGSELSGTCAVRAPSHQRCRDGAAPPRLKISYLISGHPTDHVINGNVSFVVVPLLLLS
jgi:hypothetical protein